MSVIHLVCFIGISYLLAITNPSQIEGWNGIRPLYSTRANVERVLGIPVKANGVAVTYKTAQEEVTVFYGAGLCFEGTTERCDVKPENVSSFTIRTNNKILVASLNLDCAKFKREVSPHIDTIVHYTNVVDGIRIQATILKTGEEVDSITYQPTENDEHLRRKCN